MKLRLTIETIKEAGVALEGVAVELDCSASEVIKVLAGVKTLIEEPVAEYREVKNWYNLLKKIDEDKLEFYPLFSNIPGEQMFDKYVLESEKVVYDFLENKNYNKEIDSDMFDFLVKACS